MTGRSLWDRIERLLHREHHAILLGHKDLMTLPLDERVDRGESLAGLGWLGEADGGRVRLRCSDNLAKYRPGDSLRLGNAEVEGGGGGGGVGAGVVYESFDDATNTLVVVRDPFRPGGAFDPARPLQLDPEAQSLTGLALEALARLRAGRGDAAVAARGVLEGTIERRVDAARRSEASRLAPRVVPALDPSQEAAFVEALSGEPVTLIQGPPGTGKTHVLARVVAALAGGGSRVLVTAYTHRAVNHALRKIAETDATLAVVKVGKASGADDLRGARVGTAASLRKIPGAGDPKRVIGATIFSLKSAWESGAFDVVVVDEAAQIPLAYAPCALLCAARFVLVGDHRQLGPIVRGRHAEPLASCSLFEHAAATCRPALLTTTYRMNSGLCAFPSRMFYEGLLSPSPAAANARFSAVAGGPFDDVFDPERPAVLAFVAHEGFRTRCEPEARVVAAMAVDRIVRQRGDPRDIAIVSPYRAQLRLIRTLVRRGLDAAGFRGPLPVIDTIERIQGQERDLVIVSLAASDPDHLGGEAAAFFYSAHRLNVTITRAKTKLAIVASPRAFESFPTTFSGLADVERFRRLRRELPAVDVTLRAGAVTGDALPA
jgi:DNA replication ATP-dependent helicase Dna2